MFLEKSPEHDKKDEPKMPESTHRSQTKELRSPKMPTTVKKKLEDVKSPLHSVVVGTRRLLRLQGSSLKKNTSVEEILVEGEQEPQNTTANDNLGEGNKRKRGPTKMKRLALDDNAQIEVKFNTRGQAIGAESVGLSSFLGPLVREIVPITIFDWQKLQLGMKEVLWSLSREMGTLWRASKSRLVSKLKEAKNEEEMMKLKPDNIRTASEWKAFIREKIGAEFKEKSEKFKKIRDKQMPHTTSCKGSARLTEDMEILGKLQNEASTSSNDTNILEDTLTKLFGPERNGYLRAYGLEINRTKFSILSERDDHIIKVEDKCANMEEEIKQLREKFIFCLKLKV